MLDINTVIDAFELIYQKAHAAGMSAVEKLEVVPMIVGQETSLFSNKIDYSKPTYYVADGVCGFAWVDVYPVNKGNTRAGKEERKVLEAFGFRKNDYEKSHQLWISKFNQSMQKKETYAREFAKVLRENGFKAYSGSRMD
jgi:hypothetical protein